MSDLSLYVIYVYIKSKDIDVTYLQKNKEESSEDPNPSVKSFNLQIDIPDDRDGVVPPPPMSTTHRNFKQNKLDFSSKGKKVHLSMLLMFIGGKANDNEEF